MNPWLETIAVSIVAVLGIFLGKVFSSLRRPFWLWGYFLALLLITILIATRFANSLCFMPPFCWLTAGRIRFVILSLAVTIGLTTPLSRLPRRFEKVAVCILMVLVVVWFSVLPFLVPALIKDHLDNLKTVIDSDGICFQTKDYTCAPAAAVTALRKLGFAADEGQLAILSHTSPIAGTLPLCLCTALQNRYCPDGLICRYQRFDSVAQLKSAGITLAIISDTFLSDHCVAVLEVSDRTICIADPIAGRELMTHKQFERIWRFSGITLKRDSTQKI
jgi:hypothetical protein